jgi:cathepsin A (carboxypeptidase C)
MVARFAVAFLSLVLAISLGTDASQSDLITELPGVTDFASLPYQQYSGYLNSSTDGNLQLHYWFATSQSNTSASDPLVLWLNGGPGCSSMDGFLYEHGPLLVSEDGLTLNRNPWSWNQVANMIYLESPACVGFSYSVDGACKTNDDITAEENFQAILSFLAKFPQYQDNELYITGESYAGVYVPTLTAKIFQSGLLNLKGMAIGNGLLSTKNNSNSQIDFAYGHGVISPTLYNNLLSTCCNNEELHCEFNGFGKPLACQKNVASALVNIDNPKLNVYDFEGPCYFVKKNASKGDIAKHELTRRLYQDAHADNPYYEPSDAPTVPCVDSSGADIYLNTNATRAALHIPDFVQSWSICDLGLRYKKQYTTVEPFFKTLVDGGIRVLVYNGDIDGACNVLGGAYFVDALGYPATSKYQAWHLGDQIAGWGRSYGDNLQFLTVRGAGHTVPEYKPRASLEFFYNFLINDYSK